MPLSLEVSGESHVSTQTSRTTLSYFLAAMLSLLVLDFVALLALPEIRYDPQCCGLATLPFCFENPPKPGSLPSSASLLT